MVINYFYKNGYIASSIDSVQNRKDTLTIFFEYGKKYLWAELSKGNIESSLLNEINLKNKNYFNKPISANDFGEISEKLLTYLQNNGYPFAEFAFDSVQINNDKFSAKLNLIKNQKIVIDTIKINGNSKISNRFLNNYLGIKKNDLYNEFKIVKINQRLKELQFLQIKKPFNIVFNNTKANIIIFADKKKASQFDGILGIVPNSEANGKLVLTGDVRLKLLNSFNRCELIDLNWRKAEQGSQDLKLNFTYPYLFNSPFGIDLKFSLYKKDTTYLTINENIGIQYLFVGNNYIKAFFENNTSNLLSVKTFENTTVLPPFSDVTSKFYGIEYKIEKLDYRLNPRSGIAVKFNGGAGSKSITKIEGINPDLYNNVKLNSTQYKIDLESDFYIPLLKRSCIKLGVNAADMINDQLFENELFRFGGLKTLRGFDEESIHASLYAIGTVEYRFLFEQNSFISLFWNGAYYENTSIGKRIIDQPYGFGAGLSFETKAGVFSLNYAVGKQFDNPIYFKSAKISFGIVSFF
jgi:outer membrane protein assembly factor BamA